MSRDVPVPDVPADAAFLRASLRLAAEGVATPGSGNIFRELVRHLAIALDVDHAFIGVLMPGRVDAVHIISGYFFRQFNDDFTYELHGTPCENVIGQQFRYYPERVQELFTDPHIRELGTEGYAGIPLYDSRGGVLGLMAVGHRQPLRDRSLTEALLKIFSVRAAVELERSQAEQARDAKEQELHLTEHRFRATLGSSIDSIVALDRDGHILEFNPAAERSFGYRRDAVLGRLLAPLIVPERYRRYYEQGMQLFRDTGTGAFLGNRVEIILMRADGSEFPVELAIDVAPGSDGEILIGYIRDITERREAEEQRRKLETQLQQAQKMEAIGQLTGGIAHDFNNILTAMNGYVMLAAERIERLGDDRLSRYLERAQRSGERARDLIQQMLTFSRGQRGEPRPVALEPLIREWTGLLDTTLPSSVEVVTDLDPGVPAVLCDPVQLEQVLMNLCINARDAMQAQGTLTIRLHHMPRQHAVCASCRQPVAGDFVAITVSDTGTGIAPQVQERMFEPFYSTKAVGHGSGMGLSMVHGIIHEHGGHLLLDSTPGAGTTLHILLPPIVMEEAPQAPQANVADRKVARQLNGHVLVVDDEPAVGEFMQDLLADWGLDVTVYDDSIAALAGFSADLDRYDLVILDQTMPRMTGFEVAQQLLKLRPHLPVILYTGYSDVITPEQVGAAGVRALIHKPVDTAVLHDLVEGLLAESHTTGNPAT